MSHVAALILVYIAGILIGWITRAALFACVHTPLPDLPAPAGHEPRVQDVS